jgi:hypothetical protein
LLEKDSELLPINEGILISEHGIYRGWLADGKANGKGMFKSI